MLKEAVTLRALNYAPAAFEITGSSGVTERTMRLADGQQARSWYASGPWREQPQPGPGVGSGAGPDDILLAYLGAGFVEQARETVIPLLTEPGREVEALGAAVRDLRERLHARLDALGVGLGTEGPADVIVTPPGADSTSFNYAERRYMGLHVDQHDGLPLARRGQARRLCLVNIGWLPRYLHVYPHRVSDLCRAIGVFPGTEDEEPPSHEVTARYFAANPDVEILRIGFGPGCAYILNAQDFVHDGSVPDGDAPAIAFHSMGTLQTGG